MTAFGLRASGLRLIRVVLVAIAIGTAVNACGMVTLFVLNADRIDQINQERARNVLRSCAEVNARHDGTIDTLYRVMLERLSKRDVPASTSPGEVKVRLAAALKLADPPVRAQIQQSLGSTVLLIDALAPRRDCEALVRQQVDRKP